MKDEIEFTAAKQFALDLGGFLGEFDREHLTAKEAEGAFDDRVAQLMREHPESVWRIVKAALGALATVGLHDGWPLTSSPDDGEEIPF